jgi:dCTP deaminase
MILVDRQIRQAVERGHLITDFDPASLQPASYDLRIGPLVYEPAKADHAYDMSANGGAYRLPPYGSVLLETLENLKLPEKMLGRIALKSGFGRLGLIASTGPQIDPGFEGKLFVTLFNMTAGSRVLTYRDTFLTIEFHSLDEKPDETYRGPYQGKYSIGPEVLDALVRLEGLTLSQMQSQFSELALHIREWSAFATRVDDFLAGMKAQSQAFEAGMTAQAEAIKDLTRQLERGGDGKEPSGADFRTVTPEQARDEILALFRERRKRLYYSDISEALNIDLDTVVTATEELRRRGVIEEDVEQRA